MQAIQVTQSLESENAKDGNVKDEVQTRLAFSRSLPLQKYYVQFICTSCAVCKHLLIMTAIYVQLNSTGLHTNCSHFVHMFKQIC